MSDSIVKVIPADPDFRVSQEKADEIVRYLASVMEADHIGGSCFDTPMFVDCGGNLEEIICPVCGASLDFGWWGEEMERSGETGFQDRAVQLPCCGEMSALDKLCYQLPCGFACVQFEIHGPNNEPDESCLEQIRTIIGSPVQVIVAHY